MSDATAPFGEGTFGSFAVKLTEFRRTLSPAEQQVLDGILLAAAHAEEGDVQGYVAVQRAAMAAVTAIGLPIAGRGTAGMTAERPD
jgi:hypothetical protein